MLKQIPLSDLTSREREAALAEVETLKRLQVPRPHPFIVRYHESFLYQDSLHIVMQHCSGGDLHAHLKSRKATGRFLEETVILDWLVQLLLAIRKCHECRIIHRDIKSQNIFLVPTTISAAQREHDAALAAEAAAARVRRRAEDPHAPPLPIQEQEQFEMAPAFNLKLGQRLHFGSQITVELHAH